VRALISERSNSARPPRMVSIKRPCGVVVSAQAAAPGLIGRSLHCLGSGLFINGKRERSNGTERTRDPRPAPGIISRAPQKAGSRE
jgi:hypothetical protein